MRGDWSIPGNSAPLLNRRLLEYWHVIIKPVMSVRKGQNQIRGKTARVLIDQKKRKRSKLLNVFLFNSFFSNYYCEIIHEEMRIAVLEPTSLLKHKHLISKQLQNKPVLCCPFAICLHISDESKLVELHPVSAVSGQEPWWPNTMPELSKAHF